LLRLDNLSTILRRTTRGKTQSPQMTSPIGFKVAFSSQAKQGEIIRTCTTTYTVVCLAKPCSIASLTKPCSRWAMTATYTVVRLTKPWSTTAAYIVVRLAKSCPRMSSLVVLISNACHLTQVKGPFGRTPVLAHLAVSGETLSNTFLKMISLFKQ
jgi:hypothetical protein